MSAGPTPEAPRAIDTPGLGARLRRRRRWAALLLVAGFVGALVAYNALDDMYLARQSKLSRHSGRITEVRRLDCDDDSFCGEVALEFSVRDGGRRATVHVGDVRSWHAGQTVVALVDPEDPTNSPSTSRRSPSTSNAIVEASPS